MSLECLFHTDPATDLSSMGASICSLFPEATTATFISISGRQAAETKACNEKNVDFHGGCLGWSHVATDERLAVAH